jgi:hypothetical protein
MVGLIDIGSWGVPQENLTSPAITQTQQTAIANTSTAQQIGSMFTPQYGTIPGMPSGIGFLGSYLRSLGLGDLVPWAERSLREGKSAEQIQLELWDQPAFKTRFKGIFEFERNFPNLAPPSPADVIAFESQARDLMRTAGLPEGFYDSPDDFQDLIGKGVSQRELSMRINDAFVAVDQGPQDVMDELNRLYGVSRGGLAAWALDEDRAVPTLLRQVTAAGIGAAGRRADYTLDADQLEELATFGVNQAGAQSGFQQLAQLRPLFEALPGEGIGNIGQEAQLGAAFKGDVGAQQDIARRGQQRTAQFAETGGVATDQRGAITFR